MQKGIATVDFTHRQGPGGQGEKVHRTFELRRVLVRLLLCRVETRLVANVHPRERAHQVGAVYLGEQLRTREKKTRPESLDG